MVLLYDKVKKAARVLSHSAWVRKRTKVNGVPVHGGIRGTRRAEPAHSGPRARLLNVSRSMQPVSQIIGALASASKANRTEEAVLETGQIACAIWARAVGKRIAKHTRADKLVRGRLVIEVEDAIWQRNLFTMRKYIVTNLEKLLGKGIVQELEFRVMPPRREPQRAAVSAAREPDEADGIADPGMRRLYKVSRQKGLA